MDEDVFVEGLGKAEEVHIAITSRFDWFTHDTGQSHLAQVRANGLSVRAYEPYEIPDDVKKARGGEANCKMLCLHPLGAQLRPSSSKEPPHIRFAVSAKDTPKLMGLDWSYLPQLARSRRNAKASASIGAVSMEVANELGSVSVYEGIKASLLRVWTKGAPDNPAEWPWLGETQDEDIRTF